jgi:adenine-specific DNA-methyltransferase
MLPKKVEFWTRFSPLDWRAGVADMAAPPSSEYCLSLPGCSKHQEEKMAKIDFMDEILLGDCLDLFSKVPDNAVQTIHTSPPYNIARNYNGYDDRLSREDYLDFIERVLRECKRTLVPGGALFWQTGYTTERSEYITPLDHLTFNLFQELGFRLKDRIIWRYWGGMAFKSKFTNKHETILWWVKPAHGTSKSKFDVFPVREATKFPDARNNLFGRNPGNVWEVDRVAFGSNDQTSHIAVFPEEISDRIILATTDKNDLVLDPFSGSGTVCKVAKSRNRHFLGFEISPHYHAESVHRVSLQARGELMSVLSEIIKEHVCRVGQTRKLSTIAEKLAAVLHPLSLEPYEHLVTRTYSDALCQGREDVVRKSDKIALWKALEEILPYDDSCEPSRDPAGLMFLVDRAYAKAYKLHKVHSSAMRFHCVARWINELKDTLGQNKQTGWKKILRSLADSEPGTYDLVNDGITVLGGVEKAKKVEDIERKRTSRKVSRRETANTLFQ